MTGPIELFIHCWIVASQWSPSERRCLPKAGSALDERIQLALKIDDATACAAALNGVLDSVSSGSVEHRVLTLQVMRRIDELFQYIHPRTIKLAPAMTSRLAAANLPSWLEDARDRRRSHGTYGLSGARNLIPRGPLVRSPRGDNDSYADSLADRFSYLSVVPVFVLQEDRRIDVNMRVISSDAVRGIPAGRRKPGLEVVCGVPIAEDRAHLEVTQRDVGGQDFVSYGPASTINPGERFVEALASASGAFDVDIAMAPEFLIPRSAIDQILNELTSIASPLCRLFVAGSGNTEAVGDNQPWNEAVALNGIGVDVWRQRKIWPASIAPDRAIEFGFNPSGAGNLFEDNSCGNSVEIVDIDSMGRCIILICQDFESSPMASELVRRWQPDWVFVPIMDRGLLLGGWFHQRAMSLGRSAHTRFVAVSSIALPRAGSSGRLPCLLVSCGMNPDGVTPGRAVTIKSVVAGSSPGYVIVDFDAEAWAQTVLTVA